MSSNGSVAVVSQGPSGLSGFAIAAGASRTFEFQVMGKGVGSTTLSASASGTAPSGKVQGSASFELNVAAGSPLVVVVSVAPKEVDLTVVPDSAYSDDGEPVQALVRLKNTGSVALDNVHVVDQLVIGYDDHGPAVPVVPLRQHGVPLVGQGDSARPAGDLGSLQPGETSAPITFDLIANGDGGYSVEALATADKPGGGFLHGSGRGSVIVTSPLLDFKAEALDNGGALWGAGVPYTLDVTVEDLSYRKSVVLSPRFQAQGNAQLGPLIGAKDEIPEQTSLGSCQPPQAIQLSPREEKSYKLVVYTSTVGVAEMRNGGGTRSVVVDNTPAALVVNEAGDGVEKALSADDIEMDPDAGTLLEVPLADTGLPPPTSHEQYVPDWRALNMAKGALEGIGAFEWGLFTAIPGLVKLGVAAIPAAVMALWQFEAETWGYVKDDLVLRGTLTTPLDAMIRTISAHAPALASAVATAASQANAELTKYLSGIYTDWYDGNYEAAAEEMSSFATETGLTALSFIPSVATCMMARSTKFLSALNDARAGAFAKASEAVGALTGVVSASQAAAKIAELTLGMEMSFKQLSQLYGLTEEQVNFLRNFARDNKVIITVRSRAASSIKWLSEGAVLKPEQIKIKSVSWLDTFVLGYRESDIGRVILRQPITPQQLAANLAAKGVQGGTPTYKAAFKLLAQRVFEFDHAPGGFAPGSGGYYKDLEEAAKLEKMELRWNLADNSVNPSVAENGYTTYGFRLYDEGGGNLVPQYFVEGAGPCIPPACMGGGWRAVTGDVDFLSMTDAEGRGLPEAVRVGLYEQLSGNNPINMLHPAADTWTLLDASGDLGEQFWFDAKQNEFNRAGNVPQFAPDGALPRVVKFNPKASYFDSANDYRVGFDAGYEGPLVDTRPVQGPAPPP